MASWGKAEFGDLLKLQKQLQQVQEKEVQRFLEGCVKELAARLLAKVVKRTPVGRPPKLDGPTTIKVKGASGKTKTFLSRDGAILKQYWSGYQGGTLRHGWTAGEVQKKGDTYEIEVINPVKYAVYVEYGHRQTPGKYIPALGKSLKKAWVPGKFMLTISEKELKEQELGKLEQKFEAFLERQFR